MKTPIDPKNTSRAQAFELWMASPMPMVTLTKTMDVSRLISFSRRHKVKFNMLMCYCIGTTAAKQEDFFLLPENGCLYRYDQLAVNVIVENREGGINSCDIPISDNLHQFNKDYLQLTQQTAIECHSTFLESHIIVGTSSLIQTELDSIVNQYTQRFVNPFLAWGKYRQHYFRTTLPISFQFHHVQMDGMQGALYLQRLQQTIKNLRN